MPLSLLQRAKRAFVTVLLKLALDYGVAADVNRDSDDKVILQSYRRVVKKVQKTRRAEDQENERLNQRKTTSPAEQTNSKQEDNKNR